MEGRREKLKPRILCTVPSAVWGLALAFISGLSASSSTVVVKHLRNIFPGQLAVYRFWAIASFALPQMVFQKHSLICPPTYRISVLSLTVANATAIFFSFFASRYLPLGVATAVTSTYPAFSIIAAKVFLKEDFSMLHIVALLTSTVGIVLTVDVQNSVFTNTTENIYGILSAVAGTLSFAVTDVLCRKLRVLPSSVLLFNGGIVGIIESVIITALVSHFTLHCESHQQGLIILMAVLSYVAFWSVVAALRYAEIGRVATMKASMEIFFSFVWQLTIFGDTPSAMTVIGACLIIISVIFIGLIQRCNDFLSSRC